ncbi:hypothetical protein GCM10023165_22700 [Variovorax defluvii]|uniref:Uncharacterized protein n=1 Tax=Variovorax defluvii TaxID=913761 RepID=A0ABP8HN76_9BURK
MAVDRNVLTPQERLAISRRALVEQLQGHEARPADEADFSPRTVSPRRETLFDRIAWVRMGRQIVARWWRRHPANAATQLARPLLERYAREKPAKLVAAAAGTGALLVLIRPWRLLSVTAVVAALLKTSDIADLVTTLLHKTSHAPRKDPP